MLSTPAEWMSLLRQWNTVAHARDLPGELASVSWLGSPSVSDDDLQQAEARLHVPLPPSYRAFLRASNGWRFASHAVPLIRQVGQIDWFKKEHRDWIAAYVTPTHGEHVAVPPEETYFTYAPSVAMQFRPAHLGFTLQITDVGDTAVFLLNPQVVHLDGEWEAWLLANWLPGVQRYRSFADLMFGAYRDLMGDPLIPPDATAIPFALLPTVYRDPPGREPRRIERRKPPRPLADLLRIAQDHSYRTTMSARVKAIKEIAARGDLSTIPVLCQLLGDPLTDVGCAAATALGACTRLTLLRTSSMLSKVVGTGLRFRHWE